MLRPGPRYVGVPGVSPNDHTGNLTWGMHNVWLAYRHSMDEPVIPYQGTRTGTITIPRRRGETAVITRKGARPVLRSRDVPANATAPAWGLP